MPKAPVSSSARTCTTPAMSATTASGVVMSSRMLCTLPGGGFALARLLDGADHVERRLGHVVAAAVQDCAASLQRIGQLDTAPLLTGERFSHRERLGQKALQAARALYRNAVGGTEFLDAQNRDNVLQLAVMLDGAA